MQEIASSPLPLNPMKLPPDPSWFPLAWGWWGVITLGLLIVVYCLLFLRRRRSYQAAQRKALAIMQATSTQLTPGSALELVRQVALCYFPRTEIAQLHGVEWYIFLDSHLPQPLFIPNQICWQQALYQSIPVDNPQVLIEHCRHWIKTALPPKKRSNRHE